jgi:hypothetical protein
MSESANQKYQDILKALGKDITKPLIVVSHIITDETASVAPPPLMENENLAAVILDFDEEGLKNNNFIYWMNWCIDNVGENDNFRLFVCTETFTETQLQELKSINPLTRKLTENVQVIFQPFSGSLRKEIRAYINQLHHSDSQTFVWENFIVSLGRMAGFVQISICLLAGAAACFQLFSKNLASSYNDIFFIFFGTALLTYLFILFLITFTKHRHLYQLFQESAPIRFWIILGAVLGPVTIARVFHDMDRLNWLILGGGIGLLVEIVRRAGIQFQKYGLNFETVKETGVSNEARIIVESTTSRVVNPYEIPLLAGLHPKIFISYTPHSNWSCTQAKELFAKFSTHSVPVFMAEVVIPRGTNWRAKLKNALIEANVFIAVLDNETIKHIRKWVAAEMMMALIRKRLTGLPNILILAHPDLSISDETAAVFKSIMRCKRNGTANGWYVFFQSLPQLLNELDYDGYMLFRTPSLFPPVFTRIVEIWVLPLILTSYLAMTAGFAGLFLAFLQYMGKMQLPALIPSLFIPGVFYALSYWAGFIMRLFFKSLKKGTLIALSGIILCIYLLLPSTNYLMLSWAIALFSFGVITFEFIIKTTNRKFLG